MVFTVQMFSKIIFSRLNSMKILYIALHSYWSINMESTEKNSMMPLSMTITALMSMKFLFRWQLFVKNSHNKLHKSPTNGLDTDRPQVPERGFHIYNPCKMPTKHSYFSATWQLNDGISIKLQVQHLPMCQAHYSDRTQFSWQGCNSLLVTY